MEIMEIRDTIRAHREGILLVIIIVALVGTYLSYGLRSDGVYYDDDIAHFLIAKFSWRHPMLFFDTWGRPSFTVLYAPVAWISFEVVRMWSAMIAGAVCFLAAWLARDYGVRWYWLAAIFTGFQPEFVKLGYSCLTELVFALLLCGTLLAYQKRNWAVMAVIAGWLPLARYESLPLILFLAVPLWRVRRLGLLPLLVAPLLVQNVCNAIETHNVTALLFPIDKALGFSVDAAKFDYGTGNLFYYVERLPDAYGWIVLVCAALGMFCMRFGLLQLSVLLVLAVLSVTYRFLPSAGIAGYVRHLAIVAPVVGILAARGVGCCPFISRPKITKGVLATSLIVVLGVCTFREVAPFAITDEQKCVVRAGAWLRGGEYRNRLVLSSHVWLRQAAGFDPFVLSVHRPITAVNVDQAPPGTILFWDSHYSHRLKYRTPFQKLQNTSCFSELRSWNAGAFVIYAFEKVAP